MGRVDMKLASEDDLSLIADFLRTYCALGPVPHAGHTEV